jgi:enoyl-CoA hydratase/carnithine racemase
MPPGYNSPRFGDIVAHMSAPQGRITTERRGHLFLMGFDRAAKRNAFGPEMLRGLAAAYAELERDPELRAGVVFAHGDHFTAGLDLAAVAPGFAAGEKLVAPGSIDPWGIDGPRTGKPVVVAVRGLCFTLGIELILAADVAIAARDTRFAQLEVKRGIFPFGGATFRMVERFGWGNAMRYLLTGDEFDAAEALRIGLVQEVVEPGQELERALDLAGRIARQAPLAVAATLRNARLAQTRGPEAAAAALSAEVMALMKSEDAREGVMSFVERREARFSGK